MIKTLRALGELTARFPAFKIRLIQGRTGKQSFEAVRTGGPGNGGLYALISGDAAEVAEELAADELRRAA